MTNQPSKASGQSDSVLGTIKQNVGSLLGNRSMQAEGAATRAQGDAEVKAAKSQQYTEGQVDSIGGAIKKNVGAALGDEPMRARGAETQTKGDLKKAANNY
ncbi:hypothetical protein HK097_004811 [Rhizophlyctis rosea]|uniref:CsbD-like domain-containing protein n=1 Tax=Rhizophlyctis rosea TaxID=64517 RepID=A0AAD5WX66_9FUNG|nr:hypothetical protein HK097_004811 [Rhizophlyctis rosea]